MVNITMLIISTIWFMLDLSVSSVPRPYLHMLGSSSLTRVFMHVQNWLAPVLYERRAYHTRSSCGVSARRTFAMVHTQGETYTLKFSERSSYNDTDVLSKIRSIKDKHHMQSNISDMIWPSSSCAFDLHLQSIVMISIVTGMTPWSPSSWSISMCRHKVVSPTISLASIAIT